MLSASLFLQILHYEVNLPSMQCVTKDKGCNSVEQNAFVQVNNYIVPGHYCATGHYCFRVLTLLTNENPKIYHVMH